ncbi:ankyrin-3-like [Zophobas morio]|uniref:ankyrin-3-like n=1 Tax=Zophobas morio TaxID=2755281 RepID=UPI003082DF3A
MCFSNTLLGLISPADNNMSPSNFCTDNYSCYFRGYWSIEASFMLIRWGFVCSDNEFEVIALTFSNADLKSRTKQLCSWNNAQNGDKYGIIKKISEDDDVVFDHQTYAEYFACVWLKNNTEKIVVLKKDFFSPRYNNLRLMFDVMLAENNPLHLSVLYKNTHQFEKYIDQMNIKDAGDRMPLHLTCTYRMKYRLSHPYQKYFLVKEDLVTPNRELDCYVFMAKTLAQKQFDAKNKDDLFSFDYLDYCLEANCLYPIELFLELKLLDFVGIKETIFGYYDAATLTYYSVQMGYRNLFCAVILEKPQLVHRMIRDKNLLQSTISGFKKETKNASKSLENYKCIVSFLSCSGFDINARDQHYKIPLARACETGDYEITKILLECGASVNVLDIDNMNMLHYVSKLRKRNPDILKLFVQIGIEVNAQDKNGVTPLQLACGHGIYENAKMLLECSASINIVDKDNNNSLHYASQSRQDNPDITKLLIVKSIDVNLQNNNGMTALQVSCQSGNYENSLMLLECDALMNIRDNEDNNALHHASKLWEDNRDLLKLLIKKSIHIDAQNKYGETVLQFACLKGDQEIVEMALEHNASVNISNEGLSNALHYASRSWWNNRDVIKLLIKKGIDVNAQNENGTTALQLACGNGDLEITKMLFEFGACINIVDKQNHTALNYASNLSTDNRNIIKLLIKKGINVNAESKNGITALQITCLNGVYEKIKMFPGQEGWCRGESVITTIMQPVKCDWGCEPSIPKVDVANLLIGYYSLNRYSTESTRGEGEGRATHPAPATIPGLVPKGATSGLMSAPYPQQEVHTRNNRYFFARNNRYFFARNNRHKPATTGLFARNNRPKASQRNTGGIIRLLVKNGIDVNTKNKNGITALQLACERGVYANAKLLLDCGASINILDRGNNNALHFASSSKYDTTDIVNLLITRGIDVNIQNNSGATALHLVCEKGSHESAHILLKYGSSINVVDKDNCSALHYASRSWTDNRNIIKLLIEKGIDVNIQDEKNNNALHYAAKAECEKEDIFELLIEKGINVNFQNKSGTTALHLACENALCDVAKTLLESGASVNILDTDNNNALHYYVRTLDRNLRKIFNQQWEETLQIAPEQGTAAIRTLLVENGVDVNAKNKNGMTPLLLTCTSKYIRCDIVQILLNCGALINLMDEEHNSALHYASNSEEYNQLIINLLIKNGVDVNAQNKYGTTALQLACKNGVYGNIEILLEYDASIKITDENNQSALHYALESEADKKCVIKLLIEKELGASVNTLDKCNNNALHYGLWARGDNRSILKLLVEKGVDIRVQNKIKVAAFQLGYTMTAFSSEV